MQEDFLHYLWKFQKFSADRLQTQDGEPVSVVHPGTHNHEAGPDFFNAQVRIGGQLWAGNVEIHINASDWYAHHHETDPTYDNVILHLVWQHDTEIYRADNQPLPTVELCNRVPENTMQAYQKLFAKPKKWIPCEGQFATTDTFILQNWLERLFVERLESKSALVTERLAQEKNDWEAVLFQLLAKNFGLKVNGDAFLSMAASLPFATVRKTGADPLNLEALFLGQAGLLDTETDEPYHKELQNRYAYLKTKFNLQNTLVTPPRFFRLRPDNFPTVRLAQLAALYAKEPRLFARIVETTERSGFEDIFDLAVSPFWDSHYSLGVTSKKRKKKLTPTFIDLLLINTVAVIKFCYARTQGSDADQTVIELLRNLPREENSIIKKFNQLRPTAHNAMQSQALLQLKNNYCDKKRCLQCAVGIGLLR